MLFATLRDLEPKSDVKGGSPKTPPYGTPRPPASDYQDTSAVQIVTNGTVWKIAASAATSMLLGMTVAWWTAVQGRGVSEQTMQEYVSKHTPYAFDKEFLMDHNRQQDGLLGELKGKQERVFERLGAVESEQKSDAINFSEFKTEVRKNNDLVANLLEEYRKAKK